MFDNIKNIKLIFSSKKARTKRIVKNRKGHVLIYRINGFGLHHFKNKTIKSSPGEVLFVPEGSSYVFEPASNTPCHSATITFLADMISPEPMLFDCSSEPNMLNIFLNIHKHFQMQTPYAKHMCYSFLFSIFAYLSKLENTSSDNRNEDAVIMPALEYIEKNLYDPNLKTNMLHSLCGISPAYFRRIFKRNMKLTPQKYIEEKRLKHALSILNESSYPISKIAEMVGYHDPLYFGSVFKKKYGISPSQLRQLEHS